MPTLTTLKSISPAEFLTQVSGIWAELLNVPTVSESDDFFHLGGDSVLAVVLFTQLEETFGEFFNIDVLYENPVLSDFCGKMLSASAAD